MKKSKFRMTNKQARYAALAGIVCLLLLLIDQLTKAWAAAGFVRQSDYFLGLNRVSYAENHGMAYGIFDDNRAAMIAITVLTVFMIIGIVIIFFTLFKKNKPAQMCLAIIEAGAIGNLIDRLYFGFVRDFLDMHPMGFGVCNPADWCISLGALALVIVILFIGPTSMFPLTRKWREEAKRLDEQKKKEKKKRS